MILHAYGCSWTEGEGSDALVENELVSREDKKSFRNEHSWTNKVATSLNLKSINNGIGGNANLRVFNQVIEDIRSEKIQPNDFVMVMWSSSLRDYVPFLPKGEWMSWSMKSLTHHPERFINSYQSDYKKYDDFLSEYKHFFLANVYNENYYDIVNQNYIIFLQELFKFYNIRYLFCDAFEPMIKQINSENDKTHLIDSINYWGWRENKKVINYTMQDMLMNHSVSDVWEVTLNANKRLHPNKKGYSIIADVLLDFIKARKILPDINNG